MPHHPRTGTFRWGKFVARSVHELRTPLGTIAIAAELLESGTAGRLAPRELEKLARIDHAVADVLDLLSQISELAKLEDGLDQPAAETIAPDELARALEALGGRGERFELVRAAALPPVAGERRRIERIVELLVASASAAGGRVSVDLRPGAGGESVEIAVSDTGARVPAAERETLFEPYGAAGARIRRRHGGQGLGLPLAAAHARRLGGSLELAAGGAVTTLVLRLPAARPEGDRGPGAPS